MKLFWYVLGAAVLAFTGSAWIRAETGPARHPVLRNAADEAAIRDKDIAFYAARAARDPGGGLNLAQLSALYLERARATGDNADLLRAESAARHSLANRTNRNRKAQSVLAASLVAQHRFAEARTISETMVATDSGAIAQRASLAELNLELGRYDEAAAGFGPLVLYRTDLNVAPRLARWAELKGDPEEARRLLREARDEAMRRVDLPVEQRAWFQLRLADLALRHGHLGEAGAEVRAGLAMTPDDYRLLGTAARLEAARHRWTRAIDYGERAIARNLDPATLGLLSDAYAATGRTSQADAAYRAMATAVLRQPGPFHRAWSLFLLDHNREVARVLDQAGKELTTRQDIYGYDLLAWALHRSGRDVEARAPMIRALSLGTQDAMLYYHAGMIARATGDTASARLRLQQALAINPWWHPTQPAEARAVLDSLSQ